MAKTEVRPLFKLGQVVATPGALRLVEEHGVDLMDLLCRHMGGDWGHLDDEDKRENDFSLGKRLRILSSYEIAPDEKLWVITEADRSSTCVLLPSEY